jgi:hypothetical protein
VLKYGVASPLPLGSAWEMVSRLVGTGEGGLSSRIVKDNAGDTHQWALLIACRSHPPFASKATLSVDQNPRAVPLIFLASFSILSALSTTPSEKAFSFDLLRSS